jgi:hypothetical protein
MQFRKPHPWDGGYAIPDSVMAEPPGRGTFTGRGIPRRTIDAPAIPRPWQTGYAYPDYVGQEPIGRGVFRTKYRPRKTVDTLIPEYLGDVEGFAEQDPIANFGEQVAAYIMTTVRTLPTAQRKEALRSVFNQVDPKLWGRVSRRANRIKREGVPDTAALQQAIASSTSMGLLEEFIKVGKTGKVEKRSMLGIAMYGPPESLGLSWGDLNPLSWAAKGTAKVTGSMAPGAAKVGEWGKGVISTIGNLACSVAGSSIGQVAAGAGAGAAGAPPQVGAQGAQLVASACKDQPQAAYAPPQSGMPSWLLPVAILGGLAVVAVVALK